MDSSAELAQLALEDCIVVKQKCHRNTSLVVCRSADAVTMILSYSVAA